VEKYCHDRQTAQECTSFRFVKEVRSSGST